MIKSIVFSVTAAAALFLSNSIAAQDGSYLEGEHRREECKPFSGKITGDRVRMRMVPSLIDSPIIRELNRSDLVLIDGEIDGFYTVLPEKEMKTYIFRTYVLDGVIEGDNVNVRLAPDTEAPIVAQLNTGDKVEGVICPLNNKWLEITPPDSIRFYIAKEYVENVGDNKYIDMMEARRIDAGQALMAATLAAQSEINKPFEEISIERVKKNFENVIATYYDFPGYVEKAQETLKMSQDAYIQKKMAFLERATYKSGDDDSTRTSAPVEEIENGEIDADKGDLPDDVIAKEMHLVNPGDSTDESPAISLDMTDKMRIWTPKEQALYEVWKQKNGNKNLSDFYNEQSFNASTMSGILEPYSGFVKNKPGDYVLRNHGIPVAYLYSTKVDLQENVGRQVTIVGLSRPNNDFAFPAYFVLSVK